MTHRQKKNLVRIILSALIFLSSLLVPEEALFGYLSLGLVICAYLLVGYDVIIDAVLNIFHGRVFDEKLLMFIATLGAFLIGEYPEACAVMLFYQIGELFQSIAVGKSRRAVRSLMSLRPDMARVLRDGEELELSPEEVAVGEEIIVYPGEKIPLDGIVTDGVTDINTSALTGESLPVSSSVGDTVLAGSVNMTGVIRMKATKEYGRSAVARILELVESSSEKKAVAERFITRFARYYTPAVVIAAVLVALIPPLLFEASLVEWIERALVFLVISCPCALVISVPLSFFGGIGGASRAGILIKGAGFLEELSRVDTLVLDKTGTLTEGKFTVTDICISEDRSSLIPDTVYRKERELLRIAGLLESTSVHPIAQSISAYVRNKLGELDADTLTEAKTLAGYGVSGNIDGKPAYAGNLKLMKLAGVDTSAAAYDEAAVYIAAGGMLLGWIRVSDSIKAEAKSSLAALRSLGIKKIVMLTGDNEAHARAVAQELGIDSYHASLLPENKTEILEKIIEDGSRVAFVGDGINDAPTLSLANVGIAMGGIGSDAAIESADVVLMDDRLDKLPTAVRICRKTMSIVNTNIWFAIAVKLVIMVLGVLNIAGMWLAVFGDVGVMVLAILNSLRTLKKLK